MDNNATSYTKSKFYFNMINTHKRYQAFTIVPHILLIRLLHLHQKKYVNLLQKIVAKE